MRPATTTTSPFMASRAERIGSAVLANVFAHEAVGAAEVQHPQGDDREQR
jgi:hypothetical protein